MALAPKTAGAKAGLPHENPGSPQQSATNDKHLLALIRDLGAGGVVRVPAQRTDPPPPLPGTGQFYVHDGGPLGSALIVTYTLLDGTVVSGQVSLA